MANTTISNARLTTDEPFDTTLAADLAANDLWLYSASTNGGSGIEPNKLAFDDAFDAHTHDGTDGQGQPIPAGGIATSGINVTAEIADLAVTTAKLASSTIDEGNFDDGAVTPGKFTGRLDAHFSGSYAYAAAPGGYKTIAHGLGRRPVICNVMDYNFEIISTDATNIIIFRSDYSSLDPWTYDFCAI